MDDYIDNDENEEYFYEDRDEGIDELVEGKSSEKASSTIPVHSTEIEGMVRINLSELTQKIIGCEIDENVTTEYPWLFVKKEIIEDNLDLHVESSDFLPIRDKIFKYPDDTMLIGLAPSRTNSPEFYICLTESSRDTVVRQIESSRNNQENRVKNAVFREAGYWQQLSSAENMEETIIMSARPLLQSEIVVKRDFLKSRIVLADRNADEQRDSYVELVTSRQTFNNVIKRLVSHGDDTNPETCDNTAQTCSQKPLNSWFQYSTYDYKPINTEAYNEEEARAIRKLLRIHEKNMCDKVLMNTAWDIHTDECKKLVRDKKDTQTPLPVVYTEYQNYHSIEITKDKVINDLCWHPLWTGIAIATYTDHSKSEYLTEKSPSNQVLNRRLQDDNYVLIWSLNDCLKPKLILHCFREVTSISVRPLDGNIVVGGCCNGQIAIWQISGQIERVETISAITPTQAKATRTLKNLMKWMKGLEENNSIRPTAMSLLQTSQKGAITQITWLPLYTRIGQNGRFVQLKDTEIDTNEIGWQFMTSSEDGTVAFWDLRVQNDSNVTVQKNRQAIYKHEALKQWISPLKALDDVLTPTYMLMVKHPEEERRVSITTMSVYVPANEKIQIEPFSKSTDIAIRKYYKHVKREANDVMSKMIFIGTLEGDVGVITWDGFEFANSLTINREVTSWIWRNTLIHDGPVTHSVRSKYLHDVIITVGGKAFAIWREDFPKPILMKRSTVRYTTCSWGTSRPSVVIVARVDGTIEIWDLIIKSHEPCFIQSLSGKIISGIYTHELHLNPQCVAFCDYNGSLRIFLAPANLLIFEESHVKWMRSFIDREVDRIQEFDKWQSSWKEKKSQSKEKHGTQKEEEKEEETRKGEAEEKARAEMTETSGKIGLTQPQHKPGQFIEEAKNRWNSMELKRMQQIILEKKGLKADDLDERQAPVLKLRREAKLKKKRVEETLRNKNKIFHEAVNFVLPESDYKQMHYPPDKTTRKDIRATAESLWDTGKTEQDEMEALIESIEAEQTEEERADILNEYTKICNETLKSMKEHPFKDFFNWRQMINDGEHRRRSLDVQLRNTLKKRSKAPKIL
ncbi:WD repeat-containing protein 63-like [Fopius arisanus]|uniref:WD repeat-containing protein 63-like n=1 Tax=Fopius arisanus TaxID=64838 RepID=A0A9R1TCQ8_9HYME|nr:PREDICTED: WD repeat-containing protein 63-like [Fopius arisanus]